MKKLLLIMNPCSGTKKANHVLADIINILNRGGFDVTTYMTAARADATEVAAARATEFDVILCVGGDGTFNEVISGLYGAGSHTPVGYIPAGSTNDFANSLHLSKDLLQAAKDVVMGTPRPLDIGRFNDRYFSYIASFGAFTRASYATSQSLKNTLGHFAYILSGIKEVAAIRSKHLRVTTADGTVFEDDYIFGAVTNSTSVTDGSAVTATHQRIQQYMYSVTAATRLCMLLPRSLQQQLLLQHLQQQLQLKQQQLLLQQQPASRQQLKSA